MSNKRDILSEVKNKILAEAISFISIVDVDAKENFDGSVSLYVKTNNLNTVELDKLNEVAVKFSNDEIEVQVVKPDSKVIGNDTFNNEDIVCIFIDKN
jgi:hypothetical protein